MSPSLNPTSVKSNLTTRKSEILTFLLHLSGSIQIDCPIRLIHGLSDDQVPSSLALQLMENCSTRDAAITLLKSSTHDMEDPSDMTTMRSMILEVSEYK